VRPGRRGAGQVRKLHDDVVYQGLSLVVLPEWYNPDVMLK